MSSETNGDKFHPSNVIARTSSSSSLDARHRATRTDRPSSGCHHRAIGRMDGDAATRARCETYLGGGLGGERGGENGRHGLRCGRACVRVCGRGAGRGRTARSSVARRARARSRAVVFSIVWMGLTVRIRGVCKPMCARSMDGPRRARRCGDGRGVLFVYGLLFCLCMV